MKLRLLWGRQGDLFINGFIDKDWHMCQDVWKESLLEAFEDYGRRE